MYQFHLLQSRECLRKRILLNTEGRGHLFRVPAVKQKGMTGSFETVSELGSERLESPLLEDGMTEAVLAGRARKQQLARRTFRWGWTIFAICLVAAGLPAMLWWVQKSHHTEKTAKLSALTIATVFVVLSIPISM